MCCNSPLDTTRLPFYQTRLLADPLTSIGKRFVDAQGAFAGTGVGARPLTFTLGYFAQKTQVSGIHCFMNGTFVSPTSNKIMAALFALNPITRTPAAIIAGTETAPITFATALSNYTAIYGFGSTDGMHLPVAPTIVGIGWVGLAIFIEGFGGGFTGTPWCNHHLYPQVAPTNGTTTVSLDSNLDFTGTLPGSVAPGALAGLNVSDPTQYAISAQNTQGHIAWRVNCDFLG